MSPEIGPILSGLLGGAAVGGTFLALGLLASSLVRSQMAAAVMTFVASTIFLLAGLLADQVESPWVASLLQWSSLLGMMQELAQGIVDYHWVFFHVGAVAVLTAAAIAMVDPRRRWEHLAQIVLLRSRAGTWGSSSRATRAATNWTEGRVYTLSDRAREVLAGLKAPIDVTVVVPTTIGGGRPNPLAGELREVLLRMRVVAPSLRLRFLDPDRDRQQAEAMLADYGLSGRELADGVVLIRAGQGSKLRKEHVLPSDLVTYATGPDVQMSGPRVKAFRGEEALLARFLGVSDPRRTVVCYTQGHGEPAFDSLEPYKGYAHLRDLLAGANLEVRPAELERPEGLAECNLVLVAGPEGALPAEQVRAIERFVDGGGDLLVLAGAVILRGRPDLAPTGLEALTARFGIRLGERVVLDPHTMPGATPLLAFTLVDGWGSHPAVTSLVGQPASLMTARELVLEAPAIPLLQTSEQGWAEADIEGLQSGGVPHYDASYDQIGPIPVAAASERGGARVVVIASHDFALNAVLRDDVIYDRGRDLILNTIGWLAQREALLGIRAREREHVKLVLLPEQIQRMSLVCLLGLPGFAVGLGIVALWRRRR